MKIDAHSVGEVLLHKRVQFQWGPLSSCFLSVHLLSNPEAVEKESTPLTMAVNGIQDVLFWLTFRVFKCSFDFLEPGTWLDDSVNIAEMGNDLLSFATGV